MSHLILDEWVCIGFHIIITWLAREFLSASTSTVLSIKKYLYKLNISIYNYNTIYHLLTFYLIPLLLIQIKLQN